MSRIVRSFPLHLESTRSSSQVARSSPPICPCSPIRLSQLIRFGVCLAQASGAVRSLLKGVKLDASLRLGVRYAIIASCRISNRRAGGCWTRRLGVPGPVVPPGQVTSTQPPSARAKDATKVTADGQAVHSLTRQLGMPTDRDVARLFPLGHTQDEETT